MIYIYIDKKLSDEIFFNNTILWQSAEDKFQQMRLNYYNRKTKTDNLQYDNEIDGSIDRQTTSATQIDNIENDSERFDNIHYVCDKLVWNVLDNNQDVFMLTRYKISDKMVCSINNIEIERNYEYLCQYG